MLQPGAMIVVLRLSLKCTRPMTVPPLPVESDRIVCHCLQVRESQMQECVVNLGLETVSAVKAHCGAGDGCTACHRRIREIIATHRHEKLTGAWTTD
jgi:NAD(P)H-nitrite reductase large subunit